MGQDIPDRCRSFADEEIPELLVAITRMLRTEARQTLSPIGITPAQSRALRWIARHGDPVRMNVIADALGIARRSATSVIDELVERDLVERVEDPTDRRGVSVQLSREGERVLAAADEARHAAERRMLAPLSRRDQTELTAHLRTVATALAAAGPCGVRAGGRHHSGGYEPVRGSNLPE